MAEKLGKSRTSITEILTLTAMPDEVRELCRLADIHSKSLLLQIVRQSTPEKMVAAHRASAAGRRHARAGASHREGVEAEGRDGTSRGTTCSATSRARRRFTLALQFRKSDVPREDDRARAAVDHRRADAQTTSERSALEDELRREVARGPRDAEDRVRARRTQSQPAARERRHSHSPTTASATQKSGATISRSLL